MRQALSVPILETFLCGLEVDLRKQQQWQRRIQQWQASRLSVRAFCARHCLADPGFYAWRRKLRQRQRLLAHLEPAAEDDLEVVPGFDAATLVQLLAVLEETPPC